MDYERENNTFVLMITDTPLSHISQDLSSMEKFMNHEHTYPTASQQALSNPN